MRFPLSTLALLTVLSCLPVSAQEVWDPTHTWLFAIGIVQTDDPNLASWPAKGREDAVMVDQFEKRGVPANQVAFITDQDATKANITARLATFTELAAPGDTLIFYYAGHGSRDAQNPDRPISLVTYDTKSDWPISEMISEIEQHFKGSKVLFTADCCYSGGMVRAVASRHEPFGVGVLTSARATSTSTGEWTFTHCLIDMLEGNPMLDLNGDGQITFGELASYANMEMAYGEGQLSSAYTAGSFNRGLILDQGVAAKPARVGEWCEALWKGKWYRVKILKNGGDRYFVTWANYDASENSWVNASDTRPIHAKEVPIGTRVQVKSDEEGNKTTYPATILKNQLGLCYVHYDGYPDIDNEWVTQDRLVFR